MTSPFDASEGLIVVPARIHGPAGELAVRLALDTAATQTVIAKNRLSHVGFDVDNALKVEVLTGSGREPAASVVLDRLESLEMEKISFRVLAYTLPAAMTVDGALGIDYSEDCRLTIDFRNNTIDVD